MTGTLTTEPAAGSPGPVPRPRSRAARVLYAFFPDPVDRLPGHHEPAWAIGTGLAVALITVIRVPFIFDQFWGEDGATFYQDALLNGRRESFGHVYAGYLHTIPRLIAALASALPARIAPAVFAVCVLATLAAGTAFVEYQSGTYISRRWLRIGVALPVAFLPVLGQEAIGNAANLQFFLVFFAFWGLLCFPRRWPGIMACAAALMLISMTTLVVIVVVPVAIARLFVRRRRGAWLPPVALFVGLAVQFAARMIEHPARGMTGATFDEEVTWFNNTIVANLRPDAGVTDTAHAVVWAVTFAAIVVVLVGSFIGRQARSPRTVPTPVARAMIAVAFLLFAVIGALMPKLAGPAVRYGAIPSLFLVTALCVAADHTLSLRPNLSGWVPVGIVVLALVSAAFIGRQPGAWRADAGTSWAVSIDAAREQCAAAPTATVSVRSSPVGWAVQIHCADL